VAIAYAVSEYLRTPFLWLYVGKSGPLRANHVLRAATPFVLGAHLALAAVWLIKPMLPQQHVIALASGAILAYLITIVVALAFAIGLPYGALGVAIAYAVSEYLRTPFLWLYVGKSGPLQASHVLRAATPFVLGAHLALAAIWLIKPMLPQQHVIALASGAILAYLITIVIALAFASGREALREALKMLPARQPAATPREAQ